MLLTKASRKGAGAEGRARRPARRRPAPSRHWPGRVVAVEGDGAAQLDDPAGRPTTSWAQNSASMKARTRLLGDGM